MDIFLQQSVNPPPSFAGCLKHEAGLAGGHCPLLCPCAGGRGAPWQLLLLPLDSAGSCSQSSGAGFVAATGPWWVTTSAMQWTSAGCLEPGARV